METWTILNVCLRDRYVSLYEEPIYRLDGNLYIDSTESVVLNVLHLVIKVC